MQYLNGERPEEGTLAPMFYDNIEQKATLYAVSYTHLTLPTTPYV